MSHDQIRDYLDSINVKLDALTREIIGDGTEANPGFRIRIRELEQAEERRSKVFWVAATAVIGSVAMAAWNFLKGK